MRKIYYLAFNKYHLFLILLCLMTGRAWGIGKYDGYWVGTTDQGYELSFTVTDGKVSPFKIEYEVGDSTCSIKTTNQFYTPSPINNDGFTISGSFFNYNCNDPREDYKITGTFSDAATCSGTWEFESCICSTAGSGTWTAVRALSSPDIAISPFLIPLNIVSSFDSPDSSPGGLAFDGTYLWNTDYPKIYKLDTSGNVISSIKVPGVSPRGLTFDSRYLWSADFFYDEIYRLNTTGTVIASIDSPYIWPEGLAFDGTYLWNADSWKDKIYRLDTSGNVIASIDSPGSSPTGLAFDGTDLWNADSRDDKIYRLDTSGNVIASIDSPGSSPTGLASDGTYLWCADSDDDKIYKLAEALVGTPVRSTFTVTNRGLADLEIDDVLLGGADVSEFTKEKDECSHQLITPSGTCIFDIVFTPTSAGDKSAFIEIKSNDPDTPIFTVPLKVTVVDLSQPKAMPWIPLLLMDE